MKRCMLALDVQNFFNVAAGTAHHINQLAQTMPTVATVFIHNEAEVPLTKQGRSGPSSDSTLVNAPAVFDKHGYMVPQAALDWLKEQGAEEVLLVGGHSDANVLAAGFCLFDAGFHPIMVPMLCYGNDWYMHTVTTGIWANEIGRVFESPAELNFGAV